jgi:hypothetical protein
LMQQAQASLPDQAAGLRHLMDANHLDDTASSRFST